MSVSSHNYAAAQDEYALLREQFAQIAFAPEISAEQAGEIKYAAAPQSLLPNDNNTVNNTLTYGQTGLGENTQSDAYADTQSGARTDTQAVQSDTQVAQPDTQAANSGDTAAALSGDTAISILGDTAATRPDDNVAALSGDTSVANTGDTAAALSGDGLTVNTDDTSSSQSPFSPNFTAARSSPQAQSTSPQNELYDINPDYIGWIVVKGTNINYPIVRGTNNDKYLTATFSGEYNLAGSIFMDARCFNGFGSPVAIIYGHNMKDGSMFASLKDYLEPGFAKKNPLINIVTAELNILSYRIFDARRVDATDEIFSLNFQEIPEPGFFTSQPEGAERFLVLSTCIGGPIKDERMLVFASLVD